MDAAASGTLLSKTPKKAYSLLEEMSDNNCQWLGERSLAKKAARIHKVDPIVSLSAQVLALASQIFVFTTREASSSKESAMVCTSSQSLEGVAMDPKKCKFVNNRTYNF